MGTLIKRLRPATLLDYGCGDGVLLKYLPRGLEVTLYDISRRALSLAEDAAQQPVAICRKRQALLTRKFDVIVFSLVLICLSRRAEYRQILKLFKRIVSATGVVLIAVPHPCFRGVAFASYRARYSKKQPFCYNTAQHQFEVALFAEGAPTFTFSDYHWSLSDTINLACEAGFLVRRVHEWKDVQSAKRSANECFPPFLVVELVVAQ